MGRWTFSGFAYLPLIDCLIVCNRYGTVLPYSSAVLPVTGYSTEYYIILDGRRRERKEKKKKMYDRPTVTVRRAVRYSSRERKRMGRKGWEGKGK